MFNCLFSTIVINKTVPIYLEHVAHDSSLSCVLADLEAFN